LVGITQIVTQADERAQAENTGPEDIAHIAWYESEVVQQEEYPKQDEQDTPENSLTLFCHCQNPFVFKCFANLYAKFVLKLQGVGLIRDGSRPCDIGEMFVDAEVAAQTILASKSDPSTVEMGYLRPDWHV